MEDLPDFLKLSEEQIEAEKVRQDRLRRDHNMRVRQSGAQTEFARALIIEEEIRKELESTNRPAVELNQLHDRLAEVLAAQGRFIEAAQTAVDADQQEFYRKAAAAVYDATECECGNKLAAGPNGGQLRLPKYRVIKEIYSLKTGQFGYLSECSTCGNWVFLSNSPAPAEIDPKDFNDETPNDTQRLKA